MLEGLGTKEKPYVVKTYDDLKQVSQNLSACYVLNNDIELDGEFEPIGNQFEPFTGTFDGAGHTLIGLTITTHTQYVGLFSFNCGTVKNLHIKNANIFATAYVGIIAGANSGKIENCTVEGTVTGTSKVGAFAGFDCDGKGTAESCESECEVNETKFFTEDQKNALELFVCADAPEHGDGSFEKPFKTLEQARDFIRKLVAQDFSQNIAVFLRGGTYHFEKTFYLGENDCFKNEKRITYSAYKDEKVFLVGGKPVEHWEKARRGLWRCFVGNDVNCKYLCVDGTLVPPAKSKRWKLKKFSCENVYAYFSHGWFSEILKIKKRSLFVFETQIPKSVFSGSANYLMGAVEFIKNDGDWALKDGYIYFKNPANHKITVPTVKNIFLLDNVSGITIKGFNFSVTDRDENFTAQGGRGKEGYDGPENTHGAICIQNSSNCAVVNNTIENCALTAVSIKGNSTCNSIVGNRIKNVGFAGIHCSGNWIDAPVYNNYRHFISANEISRVGLFAINGAGIYLLGSGHNYVYRNLIYDTPRYGISIKGARYHCWPTDCGINLNGEIPFDEHFKYLHSRNNLIQGNEIYDAGKNSLDSGGIEAWGPGRRNTVDYNLVYNYYNGKPTKNWKGHGIFLDDAAHYFTVTNNIVYESGKQGSDASTFMKSSGIVVRNNIFDVTNTHQGAANISPYDEPCRDQVFMNNIVYADPKGGIGEDGRFIENGSLNRRVYTYDLTAAKNQSGGYIKYLDRNLYYNTKGSFTVSLDNGNPDKDTAWNDFVVQTGFDKKSLFADPMFVDAVNRNYELMPSSPAFALGFKNIDMSKMGIEK